MEETIIDSDRLKEIGSSGRDCLSWILKGMGIESEIEVLEKEGQIYLNVLSGPDSSIAIGRKGQTLEALQILVTRITAQSCPEVLGQTKILVDVEGYRERRQSTILEMARKAAEEVQETGEPAFLEPLNSYERYLVHNALKEETGISTSSRGEGSMKQIVIELNSGETA
jgi:spoIIIJ-associated protein